LEAAVETRGRARGLHALRSRDFRLLWTGQTISLVGDGAIPVGYALSAVVAGSFSPATLLLIGFGLSAVLPVAPLSSRRLRTAA
jgi:hypothetical protein